MKFKFKIGDRIEMERKRYEVKDFINDNDPSDYRLQGPRYLLSGRNTDWSITENMMLQKGAKILNDFNPPKS